MADIETKNMTETGKNIAKILREEVKRLSEEYDIQMNDIRFANIDKDIEAVDIVYSSPSGDEITLSQMREGEIRPLKEEIKEQTDKEMAYEKELNEQLEKAYEKAGLKPEKSIEEKHRGGKGFDEDRSYKNGAAYKKVCEEIRHEKDAWIAEHIDKIEEKQDIKNIKREFKELPKDKELKSIRKEQIKAVKNRKYEKIKGEIADADKNIEGLKSQLESLYAQARKEIVTARTLGAPEKECRMSLETAEQIKDRTMKLTTERTRKEKALDTEKAMKSLRKRVWENIKDTGKRGLAVAGNAGRKAIACIADDAHDRNIKAHTRGAIAFRGMDARASQIGQEFNLKCYAADMQRVAELEKEKAKLIAQNRYPDMKKAEKKAARINIARNVKAFFKGKAPEGREVTAKDVTQQEKESLIKQLDEDIKYYKDDARECLECVQKSAEKTATKIVEVTGARDSLQMGEKGYLDEALKTARQQATRANADRVKLDRSEKTVDTGEKVR